MMEEAKTCRTIARGESEQAVATLVLAFSTDPIARWMYSDGSDAYLRHFPRLMHALGKDSFMAETAYRTHDGTGTALWLPPGVHADNVSLGSVILETVEPGLLSDVAALFEWTDRYKPTEPHWYLSLIGVETLHQAKGCGSKLMQMGLRRCDAEGKRSYLWSSNAKNVPFYERHGYKVADSASFGSSPPVFAMLRDAR